VTVEPGAPAPTRPLYWSVRRELWENRSIWIAPLIVAGVALLGSLVRAIQVPRDRAAALDVARQRQAIALPYSVVAALLILTAFLVGAFYCLDALHAERKDRSILFWKSLPVSDRTTVLSKASIPLVVLPVLAFALIVTTQLILAVLSAAVLVWTGPGVAILRAELPLLAMPLAVLYALIAITLWHAPVYAWLLLVSGWARRATILWATLPLLVVCAGEKLGFGTSHLATLLVDRLIGWFEVTFVPEVRDCAPTDPIAAIDPGKLLRAPGLWAGLALAALLLAAAVRLRRSREPI
jgi:ABC-2 type transport system permease protein